MDKKDFVLDNELEMVNFTNIDKEDFAGIWGGKETIINAGMTKQLPKFLALHYAKHLAIKMLTATGKDWGYDGLEFKELTDKMVSGLTETTTAEVKKEEVFEGLN